MTKLPSQLTGLRLPAIAAPLFIISNPDLVIAQCKAGIVGSFPALNAREKDGEPIELERWLKRITEELDRYNQDNPDTPAAPFAVNQIVHRSNDRVMQDMATCEKWQVPLVITSLGARLASGSDTFRLPRLSRSRLSRASALGALEEFTTIKLSLPEI